LYACACATEQNRLPLIARSWPQCKQLNGPLLALRTTRLLEQDIEQKRPWRWPYVMPSPHCSQRFGLASYAATLSSYCLRNILRPTPRLRRRAAAPSGLTFRTSTSSQMAHCTGIEPVSLRRQRSSLTRCFTVQLMLVRLTGLEPARVAPRPPQGRASTYFATDAKNWSMRRDSNPRRPKSVD
jgi:hypothetical protein